MPLPWRDSLATLFVALSLVVYAAWAIGAALPGFGEVAPIAVAVLVLGVAASMSAVVPGWDDLVHGSRLYFGAASAIGLAALVAGLWAVAAGEAVALALLVAATVVLWAMSTMRHVRVHRPDQRLHLR
jgi:hypothetical protein